MKYKIIFCLFAACSLKLAAFSQEKAQQRYEIDAKRIGVSPVDKDALPRSREFLRLDSTYYVGWMYEGMYKYDRSADYLGYKNAIPALRKAFDLANKDFGQTYKNLYSSIFYFSQNVSRYQDLFMISNALKECYDNIEMPDSVMALLDKIDSYHFRRDFFGVFYHRAWTYHRNRFLTSNNFDFLDNSVADNEKEAFKYCYQGLAFIEKNKAENDAWFGPQQSEQDKGAIYHYLALLHCYNKNYDSSEYYYQQLVEHGNVSWNNYGGMQSEVGKFANAIDYFSKDLYKNQHILREPYYYVPELFIYGGKTKQAITMVQQAITESGSTPGFGWYNISLGRAYLYDGQLDSAAAALDKAANFKELHIGTTLTQNQYDFTINLLRVQLADKRIAEIKFLNSGWWYSPSALYKLASLKVDKMLAEYVVVNELAYNPERVRLVYDLFCAEATSSYDEAWFLMKDFSPAFFQKKYEAYQKTDKRENVQRYFKLFAAKFKWEAGKETDARKDYESLETNVALDTANEKLFIARLYDGLCKAYKDSKDNNDFTRYSNMMFEVYPQLVPFSGVKISMQLNTAGVNDDVTQSVIKEIKKANVNWQQSNAPVALIQFAKRTDKYEAIINVKTVNGKTIVANQRLVFKNADGVGNELALRLFGKGGAASFDKAG